jgi:hypothetical protein
MRSRWPLVVRLVPAVAIAAVLVGVGQWPWNQGGNAELASSPSWKRLPGQIHSAQAAIGVSKPGDIILAPIKMSRTIDVLSGRVTAVGPRSFYVVALKKTPAGHWRERQLLQALADFGLFREDIKTPMLHALNAVGVDTVCLPPLRKRAIGVLLDNGWHRAIDNVAVSPVISVSCLRR